MPTHLDHRVQFDEEEDEPEPPVIKAWFAPALVFSAISVVMIIMYLARC